MRYRSIMIDEETYDLLSSIKHPDETVADRIRTLALSAPRTHRPVFDKLVDTALFGEAFAEVGRLVEAKSCDPAGLRVL